MPANELVVIAPTQPPEFFDLLWEGIRSATLELAPLGVQVQSFRTELGDVEGQRSALRGLLGRRVGAIALVPAYATALDDLIEEHAGYGTPVITFVTDAPGSKRASYVGADAEDSGALAGELLCKFLRKPGSIVSFPGGLAHHHLQARYDGFRCALQRWAPQRREEVFDNGTLDLGAAARSYLSRAGEVSGIYVGCSRVFQVARVLEELGIDAPCVGFDNTAAVRPYLQSGAVSAVIDESTYQQGYIAVQRAFESATTRPAPSEWVQIPTTVITASNCAGTGNLNCPHDAFEVVIRQRTAKLHTYQEQLKAANTRLSRLAETDALTGLLNRRKFESVLEEHVNRRAIMAILMVDLNSFKEYNDSFGHHVGDQALRLVSRVLAECSRDRDFCARLGGDEFCMLLPGAEKCEAARVKRRIVSALEKAELAPSTLQLRISASVGIAAMPDDGNTVEDLLVAADRSMYTEKRRTRSRTRARVSEHPFCVV